MHDDKDDDLTRILASIGASVTFTGLTVYYAWQIILGMPILATLIGITTGIAIILLEILSVCWVIVSLAHRYQKYKMLTEENNQKRLSQQLNQQLNQPPTTPI